MPGKSRPPRGAETNLQAHKGRSTIQRQQAQLTPAISRWQKVNIGNLLTEIKAIWHHPNPILPLHQVLDIDLLSISHPNTAEKQDLHLTSQLMMLTEGFKKDMNNSLKETQKNTSKQG